jgi:hypothetical protein
MLNALRRGGNVAIVFDQRVKPWNGILIPFLGRNAWITPLVASLSIHTGAAVVPVSCVPEAAGRYRVTLLPPILPEGKGLVAEVALTRRYLEPLERQIRERPELWLWMHRLWRLTQREWRPNILAINRRLSGQQPPESPIELDDAVRPLTDVDFLEQAENAVVVAGWEAGTRTGRGLVEAALEAGHRVRFVAATELAHELAAARSDSELDRVYRELDVFDLLLLDGLGREPLTPGYARELVELLAQREGRRSTVVTTRVVVREWERVFGDAASAQAARESLGERQVLLPSTMG